MERIKLSKHAKNVMLALHAHNIETCPRAMLQSAFNHGARELQLMGLAICHEEESGNVEAAQLTELGSMYIAENPSLSAPVNWTIISIILGGITAICSILALLIACSKL